MSRAPVILAVAWVLLLIMYIVMYLRLPRVAEPAAPQSGTAHWPDIERPAEEAWRVFQPETDHESQSSLSGKYRLAGTHFGFGGPPGEGAFRMAVLEDLDAQSQDSLEEGEYFGDVQVVEIGTNHVRLRQGMTEEVLRLSFAEEAADPQPESPTSPGPTEELRWDERVLDENRFGRRIAENRWILSRDILLQYRQDLLDDPERLTALFGSMRADYINGQVSGYRLQKRGEEEFYDGVGLLEGDIIRKVNSMKMKNQERSEYFIREFVSNRLSAVVLEVERNGQEMKLIYYLR